MPSHVTCLQSPSVCDIFPSRSITIVLGLSRSKLGSIEWCWLLLRNGLRVEVVRNKFGIPEKSIQYNGVVLTVTTLGVVRDVDSIWHLYVVINHELHVSIKPKHAPATINN